ncbi:fimbrial protein [Escherichia coli]|nr:fimbrial protein [Escherichia coli]
MKKNFILFISLLFMGYSLNVMAFTCSVTESGQTLTSGSANINVRLSPQINAGQNQVVDLSSLIMCKNDANGTVTDFVKLLSGGVFSGNLSGVNGGLYWNSQYYALPLRNDTGYYVVTDPAYRKLPLLLSLIPDDVAGGIIIKKGEKIAQFYMNKYATDGKETNFIWNIYASNDVVVPTGSCDVSSRDIAVTLPTYPGEAPVPLTVRCVREHNISFYLSGNTTDSSNSVFRNNASQAAQGIGVQIKRNNTPVPINSSVNLGVVGNTPVNLGLTATYAQTGGQITGGAVQSVIGVTFVYQ